MKLSRFPIALGLLVIASSGCAPHGPPHAAGAATKPIAAPSSARSTALWGYVYKVSGTDTIPARAATVWTDPPSDQVFTDSTGYWEIRDGLVDSRYRVLAKSDGVNGRTTPVDISMGKKVKASVLIGIEETSWPPSLSLDDKAPSIRKGPKGTRCCDQ